MEIRVIFINLTSHPTSSSKAIS